MFNTAIPRSLDANSSRSTWIVWSADQRGAAASSLVASETEVQRDRPGNDRNLVRMRLGWKLRPITRTTLAFFPHGGERIIDCAWKLGSFVANRLRPREGNRGGTGQMVSDRGTVTKSFLSADRVALLKRGGINSVCRVGGPDAGSTC